MAAKDLKKWTEDNIKTCIYDFQSPVHLCSRCQNEIKETKSSGFYLGLNQQQLVKLDMFCEDFDDFIDDKNADIIYLNNEMDGFYDINISADDILPHMQKIFKKHGFSDAMKEGQRIKTNINNVYKNKLKEIQKIKIKTINDLEKEIKSII